jgi:hypothetical protein
LQTYDHKGKTHIDFMFHSCDLVKLPPYMNLFRLASRYPFSANISSHTLIAGPQSNLLWLAFSSSPASNAISSTIIAATPPSSCTSALRRSSSSASVSASICALVCAGTGWSGRSCSRPRRRGLVGSRASSAKVRHVSLRVSRHASTCAMVLIVSDAFLRSEDSGD